MRKYFYILLVLVGVISVYTVACKNKSTNTGNLSVVEEAGQTPTPEFPSDSQNNKLTIDTNQGLIQFKQLSFKSGAYYLNGDYTRKIYYYADVKVDENSKPYISVITKYESGEIVEDEGKFYDNENGKGAVYNLEGVRYNNNRNSAQVTFTEDGYLRIKFSNYSLEITYSLINGKTSESETENDEISKDGAYIPEVFWGIYDVTVGVYAVVSPATVSSNYVRYSNTYYIQDYIGNNTWYVGDQHGFSKVRNQFFRNEKGQRTFYEILEDGKYTNIFVHRDDTK